MFGGNQPLRGEIAQVDVPIRVPKKMNRQLNIDNQTRPESDLLSFTFLPLTKY